jgi:S-disulfanyl-L-cysteine oxidoreductase SoxD
MRRRKLVLGTVIAAALLLLVSEAGFGWPWSTDMYWQPAVRTFSAPVPEPPEGTLAVGAEPALSRDEARDSLTNPVAATPESLGRGQALFETFCFPCHGTQGHGDGPVGKKFVTPANLTLPMYLKMTDGYIYGTIRNGALNMPPQGTALSPEERWDVVNYVRSLQQP